MVYLLKKKIRELSNNHRFVKKLYYKVNILKVNILKVLSDETFAKIKYYENTGKHLNLINPQTYDDKLWWLKLNNRDPMLTKCSSKATVRDYLNEKGYSHLLIPIIGVYDTVEEIDFQKIEEKVFIKCTHGSGTNMIYDPEKDFDHKDFKNKFSKSLRQNYYLQSREWNYKNIKPQIIVEKVLEFPKEQGLLDYRFLCFEGKVKLVYIDTETSSTDGSHNPEAKRNIYTPKFEYLDARVGRENFPKELVVKPINWDEMISIAEDLSEGFVHCRVDLYNISGKIYFGEITFYPGGGTQKIYPESLEKKMYKWLNLQSEKMKIK